MILKIPQILLRFITTLYLPTLSRYLNTSHKLQKFITIFRIFCEVPHKPYPCLLYHHHSFTLYLSLLLMIHPNIYKFPQGDRKRHPCSPKSFTILQRPWDPPYLRRLALGILQFHRNLHLMGFLFDRIFQFHSCLTEKSKQFNSVSFTFIVHMLFLLPHGEKKEQENTQDLIQMITETNSSIWVLFKLS